MTRFFAAKSKGASKPPIRGSRRKSGAGPVSRGLRLVRRFVLLFFLATAALTLVFGVLPPPATPLMLIRCVQQLTGGDPVKLYKDWTPLDEVSPHIVDAVIAAEDQQFLDHRGFDFESILSAFAINSKGRRKLGASTITQQTAKNLFLWPARSWTRKGLEAYFTFLMETFWTKRRILTVYLNIIETGPGIYGVEAACRHNFGVSARRATRSQAALLAATLPNPRRWEASRPTAYLWRRHDWILRQMDYRGPTALSRTPSRMAGFFRKIAGRIARMF